ncbi:hypothetical protein [Catellatospora paridis]|uniref:hypothetical protein n=1 Tax=Catellatospora paridis TaxID=1617086 RepID=UPI0012D3D36C|nr:hypothetical protein [Catellatospora paridis]
MKDDDGLMTSLIAGRGVATGHLLHELRPEPNWLIRWTVAIAVMIVCGLAGYHGSTLLLELSTRLELAWTESSWQAPPPPELPPTPFGHAPGPG